MTTDKGLLVWLPLVSDLHNLGLNGGTVSSNGTPSYSSTGGKLGGCYSTSTGSIRVPYTNKATNQITIALWIKPQALNYWVDIFTLPGSKNRLERGGSATTYYWYCNNTDIGSNGTAVGTIPDDLWTHVAWTFDGSTSIIYLNGVETKKWANRTNTLSAAMTSDMIHFGDRIDSDRFIGSYNDIRVYSYALSPLEIKELSRGKVGHWLGNEELVTSVSNKWDNGNFARGTSGYSIPYSTADNSDPAIFKITRTTSSSDNNNIYRSVSFTANHIYCLVAHLHSPANTGNSLEGSGWTGKVLTIASKDAVGGKWDYVVRIYKATDNCSGACVFRSSATLGAVMQFKKGIGILLYDLTELGMTNINTVELAIANFGTSYAGHPAFLSDISGNHLNLDVKGNGITLNTSTPRYDKCLSFDGNGYLETNSLNINSSEPHTLSFWFYPKTDGLMICSFNNGLNLYTSNRYISLNNGSDGTGNRFNSWLFTVNTWYHIVITFNGSTARLYVNGEDKGTAPTYRPLNGTKMIVGAYINGTSYRYTGMLSDIRIYATALDTTAIQELKALGH